MCQPTRYQVCSSAPCEEKVLPVGNTVNSAGKQVSGDRFYLGLCRHWLHCHDLVSSFTSPAVHMECVAQLLTRCRLELRAEGVSDGYQGKLRVVIGNSQ